jgi:hypothetical protein
VSTKPKLRPPAPLVKTEPPRKDETIPTAGDADFATQAALPLQKTRAYFREEEFIRALRQQGKFVLWRKALLCPCYSPETQQAQLACVDCGGGGYLWIDPLHIQALMLMFDKRTSIYEKFGLWQEGNIQITTEPQHRLGYRDSIEMLDSVVPMNELLTKGDRRGRRQTLPEDVDSARFRIVRTIAALYRCEKSRKLVKLEPDQHFRITPEGWIRWTAIGDNLVPKGATISLHYEWHPVFLVQSWMHVERSAITGRKAIPTQPRVLSLPTQAAAKLMFLVDANSTPSLDPIVPAPSGFGPGGPAGHG